MVDLKFVIKYLYSTAHCKLSVSESEMEEQGHHPMMT